MAALCFKGNSDDVGDDEKEELQNTVPLLTLERVPKYDCKCLTCHQVAIDHRIANCDHMFCKSCFDKIKGRRCPIHKEVEIKTYHKDKKMSTRIMDLKVFCPYKDNGCKESKALKGILNHIQKCRFKKENILPKLYRGKPRDDDIDELTNSLTALQTSIHEVELKLKKIFHFNSAKDSILTRCRNDIDALKKITDSALAEINLVKNNYEELKEQISKTSEEKSKEYKLQLNKFQRNLKRQQSSEIEHQLKIFAEMQVMHQQILSTQTENLSKRHDAILTQNIEFRNEITNSIVEMNNKIKSHSASAKDTFATLKNEMKVPLQNQISKLENEFHNEFKSYGKRLMAMKAEIQQKDKHFNERFQLLVPQNEAQVRAQMKEIVRNELTEYQEVTLKPQIMNAMKAWEEKNEATVKNQTKEIKLQLIPIIHDILSKHDASTLLNKVTDLKSACSEEVSNLSSEFQEIINPLLNIPTEYRLPQLISQIESKATGQRERPADEMALAILKLSATDANQRESRIAKYVKAFEDKMENCIEKFNTLEKTMQSELQNEVESCFSKLRNESQDDVNQQPEQHILEEDQCLEEDKHQSADESFEEKYQPADESFKEDKYQSADNSFEEDKYQTTDHSTEKYKHQTVVESSHQPENKEYYEMTTWKVTGIKQKLLKNEQQNGGNALSHDLQFPCQLCCELIAQLEIVGKSDLLLISLKSIHDASNYDECSLASLHVTEYRLLDQSESSKKNDIRLVDQLDHLRRDVQPTKTNLVSITELKSNNCRFVKDDCIVIQIIIKPKHLLYGHVAS